MKNFLSKSILLTGLATALALAANPAMADAPPKEVTDMASLVGTWKGSGTLTMGTDRADVKITWTCQAVSGSWGVQCQARFTGMPGGAPYQETDLFGYEPGTRKYHWFSVTSMGETHDHVSDGLKENTIEFVHNGVRDGKPLKEVIRMTFGDKCKSFDLRSEMTVAGQVVAVLEGHAHK
jgi:hypothetical protein